MKKLYLIGSAVAIIAALVVIGASRRGDEPAANSTPAPSSTPESTPEATPTGLTEASCKRPDGELWNFAENTIRIANQPISIAIADTHDEKQKGLGGCEKLPEGAGMVFVFNPAGVPTFWMKDTLIPLDIVWIADGKVVGVEHGIQPEPGIADGSLKRYKPTVPVAGALELSAGTAERLGITEGASVAIGQAL